MAKSDQKVWMAFLTAAVIFLILMSAGYVKLAGVPGEEGGPTPEQQLVDVNKPLKFAVMDPIGGSAVGGASVQIYDSAKALKESLTADANGTALSALPYASGTVLNVRISAAGYVTRWIPVTVPKMSPADAQSLTHNFIALETRDVGTYTIKAYDQFGNDYDSTDTINFTALGVNTITLQITIINTEDNSGWIGSYDPINGVNLKAVMVASTSGSDVTVTNAGQSVTRGSVTYWMSPVADDAITKQLVGSTYVKSGVTSITITIGKGALQSNETQDIDFNLYGYFDPAYFALNGIGGPDATVLASFSLTFAA